MHSLYKSPGRSTLRGTDRHMPHTLASSLEPHLSSKRYTLRMVTPVSSCTTLLPQDSARQRLL
jgi:hypothetical protein